MGVSPNCNGQISNNHSVHGANLNKMATTWLLLQDHCLLKPQNPELVLGLPIYTGLNDKCLAMVVQFVGLCA